KAVSLAEPSSLLVAEQGQLHHNVGLLILAELEDVLIKGDKAIFLIKSDGPRVFFPYPKPEALGLR
nr:hypothetical protein [Tanacetum cinerariifolium]